MYISNSFIAILAATTTTQAFQFSTVTSGVGSRVSQTKRALSSLVGNLLQPQKSEQKSCPAVWSEISTALTAQFLADGQCTDAARAAIRAAFHDCFNGACDGSLILANECSNSENRGLERLCGNLGNLASEKKVGVADLIQFAGAHAIKTCPGGPTVPVKIGRKDSSDANTIGVLPTGREKSNDLIKLFASKGFSVTDLVALIGAHSVAKQRTTDPSKAGASLDSTPGQWDNKYYSETTQKKAPFTLESDRSLATNLVAAVPFNAFALSKSAWAAAFVGAMQKMSMLGVEGVELTDCTAALPGGSNKRDVKSSPIGDRMATK
ncbi:heme peroxidase [Massariosphaeria phaeospora]|uniref:Peroxidase n=1 Tax=Massariosphaeria phaeospora TaxID=100035 RepID=A0A7C8MH91_9PLEO|nr:heme peroxidase [Massariosphaeria phaeospora]